MLSNPFLRIFLFLIASIFCSNCASIVAQKEYSVSLQSKPEQATVSVKDLSGTTVFEGQTPASVVLPTNGGYFQGKSYIASFTKEGFAPFTAYLQPEISGLYVVGNGLFGNVIGWLIADPLFGGMWRLPTDVSVVLQSQKVDSAILPSPTKSWGRCGLGASLVLDEENVSNGIIVGSDIYGSLYFEVLPHVALGFGLNLCQYTRTRNIPSWFGNSSTITELGIAYSLQGTMSYRFFENTSSSPYFSIFAGPSIGSFPGPAFNYSAIFGYQLKVNRLEFVGEIGYSGVMRKDNDYNIQYHFFPIRFGAQFYF